MDLAQQQSVVFLALSLGVIEGGAYGWRFPAEKIEQDANGQPQFTAMQWQRLQAGVLEKRPELAAKPEIPDAMPAEDLPMKDEPVAIRDPEC